MPNEIQIGLWVAGAVLLLAAVFGTALRIGRAPRLALAVIGIAVVGYGLWLRYRPITGADFEQAADSAFADCHVPPDPVKPPDGNTASKDDMMAAQKSAKAFDGVTNAYIACLDVASARLKKQYNGLVTMGEFDKMEELQARLHNAAIDRDEAQANGFNTQLRIFRAKASPSAP